MRSSPCGARQSKIVVKIGDGDDDARAIHIQN